MLQFPPAWNHTAQPELCGIPRGPALYFYRPTGLVRGPGDQGAARARRTACLGPARAHPPSEEELAHVQKACREKERGGGRTLGGAPAGSPSVSSSNRHPQRAKRVGPGATWSWDP